MRVIKSTLPVEGVVKIPQDSFEELKIKPGDMVQIEAPLKGSLEAIAQADSIYTVNGIRIGYKDLEKLGVVEGEGVIVRPVHAGSKEPKKNPTITS